MTKKGDIPLRYRDGDLLVRHNLKPELNDKCREIVAAALDGHGKAFFRYLGESPGVEMVNVEILSEDLSESYTPVMCAVMGGDPTIMDATINASRMSLETEQRGSRYRAIHVAINEGSVEGVGRLLSAGAEVDSEARGLYPLHLLAAAQSESALANGARIVELLAAAGSYLDMPDGLGQTPLMLACRAGKADLVSALLSSGADPFLRDMNDWRADGHLRAMYDGGHFDEGRFTAVRDALAAAGMSFYM